MTNFHHVLYVIGGYISLLGRLLPEQLSNNKGIKTALEFSSSIPDDGRYNLT